MAAETLAKIPMTTMTGLVTWMTCVQNLVIGIGHQLILATMMATDVWMISGITDFSLPKKT